MPEMTPQRRAAWLADQQERAAKRKVRALEHSRERQKQYRKAVAKAKKLIPIGKSAVNATLATPLEEKWYEAYTSLTNFDGVEAARIAGYAPSPQNLLRQSKRLKVKFARRIAQVIGDRDSVFIRVFEQAMGHGDKLAFDEKGKHDQAKTIENLANADQLWKIASVEETKYGQKLVFRDADMALRIIAAAVIPNTTSKVDVNVQLSEKTEQEKAAIREAALQKALMMRQSKLAIEGEFRDDSD